MEKTAAIKVKDLPPEARNWLQSIFHIDLTEKAEFTVMLRPPIRVPSPEQRQAAAKELNTLLDKMSENMKDVSEEEFEAALDEALKAVRPTYERHD